MILFNITVFSKNIYVSALEKRKLKQFMKRITSITKIIPENIYMLKMSLCMCHIGVCSEKRQALRFVRIGNL